MNQASVKLYDDQPIRTAIEAIRILIREDGARQHDGK